MMNVILRRVKCFFSVYSFVLFFFEEEEEEKEIAKDTSLTHKNNIYQGII